MSEPTLSELVYGIRQEIEAKMAELDRIAAAAIGTELVVALANALNAQFDGLWDSVALLADRLDRHG